MGLLLAVLRGAAVLQGLHALQEVCWALLYLLPLLVLVEIGTPVLPCCCNLLSDRGMGVLYERVCG